eukprot:7470163-Pyramimonas_sp.AAC.1
MSIPRRSADGIIETSAVRVICGQVFIITTRRCISPVQLVIYTCTYHVATRRYYTYYSSSYMHITSLLAATT